MIINCSHISLLGGFEGMILGEVVQFGVYFDAILFIENFKNIHLLPKGMIL